MYLSSYATNRYFIPNWGKVMTNMFGMEVTRLEGLRVYGAFGLMTVGAALSGVSLLVTGLCVALAGYNVYKLNVEHPEEKGGEE